MPYIGSNAEYLNKMCLYDLLCKMNSNIEDANAHGETPCIMNALTGKTDIARCQYYENECAHCISAWLNERRVTP